MNYDVIVIGAGITGAGIAYELSKKKLKIAIVDKAPFPFQGASKANSGIIHAGYDDPEGSLRARLVVEGNRLYSQWAEELGFDFKRPGSIVVAFNEEELERIRKEKNMADERGIPAEIVEGKDLFEMEPNLNREAIAALHAPTAGVVCPMEVVNLLFRAAVMNGAEPHLATEVMDFERKDDRITGVVTSKGVLRGELIINAAGVFGDVISSKAGIDGYKIIPRKGEYILLEPHPDYRVNKVIFPTPTRVSKGVLVIPTVTGDVLLGPTAVNLDDDAREDRWTTPSGLKEVFEKAKKLIPSVDISLTVKTFAGIRAQPNTNDFIIEDYESPSNFINAIGIRSPGLTSAPAIARMVAEMVGRKLGGLSDNENFKVEKMVRPDPLQMALNVDVNWGKSLTPHFDSPPYVMLEMGLQMGLDGALYNYTCFTHRGLGVDLSSVFQNQLAKWLVGKGIKREELKYRFPGSWQFIPEKCRKRSE